MQRINNLKTIFVKYRSQNTTHEENDDDETHFNILKLHVLTHYIDFIRLYDIAQSFDTVYEETTHKFLFKIFFARTNKTENWKKQIMMHNIRHNNIIAMQNILLYSKSKSVSVACQQLNEEIIKAFRDSMNLSMSLDENDETHLLNLYQNSRHWRRAKLVATESKFECLNFIDALTMFIREQRKRANDISYNDTHFDIRERDSFWAKNYFVEIHKSLICWKRDEKNSTNSNRLEEEKMWCASQWRNRKDWRRDSVWVQKNDSKNNYHNNDFVIDSDKCVEQLLLIIFVLDHERLNYKERSRKYIEALIDVKRWLNNEAVNKVHEMFEVKTFSINKTKNFKLLHSRRFYDMSHVIRNVHLMSTNEQCTRFYVNNFID